MIRKILVPLDGSEFGEHALPLAVALARRTGAMLHLIHVHQPSPTVPAAGLELVDLYDTHLKDSESSYMEAVAQRVRDQGDVQASSIMLDGGDVAEVLRDYAKMVEAEMAVMATHGRGAMGRWWLGSVADELARTLPRPIVLVRPEEGKADLKRLPPLSRILVALDGTPLAEEALGPALELAKVAEAAVLLVRVCAPALRASYLPYGTTQHALTHTALEGLAAAQRREVKECQGYLDNLAQRLRGQGREIETLVVIDEDPANGILEAARERSVSLIAMESHGRTGLSRLFMGSVADRVVRGGGVPVLVNRPSR